MSRLVSSLVWLVACAAVAGAMLVSAKEVVPVRVGGGSMEPSLEPGDIVLVRRGASPRVRDIVLIRRSGHPDVLHRVVGAAGSGRWVTQGDANPVADLKPVQTSAIEGRVVSVLHLGAAVRRWRHASGDAKLANQSDSTRQ